MKLQNLSEHKAYLYCECILLFAGIPVLLLWWQLRVDFPFFPVLFGMLLLCGFLGSRDPQVRFTLPKTRPPLGPLLRPLLPRFILVALSLLLITWLLNPELLFKLPREQTRLWLSVMILYPLLSVPPQEWIFRSFFMPRYQRILPKPIHLNIVNTLLFAWAHLFFLNAVAPLLCLPAGWMLADSWQKHKDFRVVCIEHAIYGQLLFSSGAGWYFSSGSLRALESLLEAIL